MERFKVNINKSKLSVACLALALGLTGCNSNKVRNDLPDTTESTTTATTEITTEENNLVSEELNINDNISIENVLDENYNTYKEFYTEEGISKDDLRDVIFVLNDKYQNEDGKLLLDEARVHNAYSIIRRMLVSDSIYQSMDNINTIESDEEIGKQIDNSWNIPTHPSFVTLIDKNISGGEATIEKIKEFEELRNHEVEVMNETNKIDVESINNFVVKMEIDDYNNNEANISKVKKNGQKFLLGAYKFKALDLAAKANPHTIYLEGYEGIDKNIKINPTNEESFLESDIITMIELGDIDGTMVEEVISFYESNGFASTTEEDLIKKFGMSDEKLKLVLSYVQYAISMANHKYDVLMCNSEAKTVMDIESIKEYSDSMSKQYKKEQ